MKKEIISEAVSGINDKYIQEAADYSKQGAHRKNKKAPFRYAAALAAALALCVMLAVPAVALSALTAADVDYAYDILYSVAPEAAQRLKPVSMSCESNGIIMEIISAKVEGGEAQIYIAMKDNEGDRIDETIDLYDSYHINCGFDSVGHCQRIGYDEESGVATFLINISPMNDKEVIRGKKITFSVGCFLSNKKNFSGEIPQIDLGAAATNPEITVQQSLRGGSFSDYVDIDTCSRSVLVPQAQRFSPVQGVEVTASGFVDGMLHIQVLYDDIRRTDNHGFLWLKNKEGFTETELYSLSWFAEDGSGSYQEYVFDVSPEEAEEYIAYGEFTTSSGFTEGEWQVTFPIEE